MASTNPFGRQAKGMTIAALEHGRGQRAVAFVLYDANGCGIGTLTTDVRGAWELMLKLQAAIVCCDQPEENEQCR